MLVGDIIEENNFGALKIHGHGMSIYESWSWMEH